MLIDPFGRAITYLRISLTDRCNLRCVYCLPAEGLDKLPTSDLLTAEEIAQIVKVAARHGISRVRLTGGEPLMRRDLTKIVTLLMDVPGIDEVSLTTNAMLLAKKAAALAAAGLTRVNVSLDTLDPAKYRRITRGGHLERVFQGINAAEKAGLTPVKINTVVVRGLNDDELPDLARLSVNHPWHIRFIELMPVGNGQDWGPDFPNGDHRYLSMQEMQDKLAELNLETASSPAGNGPARTFRIPGAPGSVGFISPLGEHFCDRCNRLRLTADGKLRPCLLQDTEISLRKALAGEESVFHSLEKAVRLRPRGHQLLVGHAPEYRRMAQIGG